MADGFKQLSLEDIKTVDGINHLNRMLQHLYDNMAGNGADLRIYSGTGVPTIPATSGSIYLRTDGGASTSIYVREGSSWTAK